VLLGNTAKEDEDSNKPCGKLRSQLSRKRNWLAVSGLEIMAEKYAIQIHFWQVMKQKKFCQKCYNYFENAYIMKVFFNIVGVLTEKNTKKSG